MRHTITILAVILALAGPTTTATQMGPNIESAEPFKLGTFETGGRIFVGVVLRDELVVELHRANADLEGHRDYATMPMPDDMLGLIERYDYGLKYRLYEIVNHLVENDRLAASTRPGYVHPVGEIRTLAPIRYPGKILNAAVNFYSHISEAASDEARQEAIRQRQENKGVPYLFLKPARGAVVGNGDNIVIIGVGVIIPPWNFPLAILTGMTVASIVTGNTVVLKPASDSPFVGFKFMEIIGRRPRWRGSPATTPRTRTPAHWRRGSTASDANTRR